MFGRILQNVFLSEHDREMLIHGFSGIVVVNALAARVPGANRTIRRERKNGIVDGATRPSLKPDRTEISLRACRVVHRICHVSRIGGGATPPLGGGGGPAGGA